MLIFIIRRILQIVPLLLVVSAVVYVATVHLPGDPAITVVGIDSTAEQRERAREIYGFDDPVLVQYGRWLSELAQGNFGRSLRTREPVAQMLAQRAPVTIELALLSMVLAAVIGIPAGLIAAHFRGGVLDAVTSTLALVAVAIPFFWLGVLLIILVSLRLGLLPPSGYVPFWTDPIENLKLMIMPSVTVGTAMAALIMRQTRSAVLQVRRDDFVRTARAKGVPERRVVTRHILPNALIPVLTVLGLQVGALLGGAVVTERVFSLPGVGTMLVEGIFNRDFPVVQGAMLFIIFCVMMVNLITDVSYAMVDSRIRYR